MNFKTRQKTDFIVIHCAATRPKQDIGVKDIDQWHRKRGFVAVGYHMVIRRNGEVEIGRPLDAVGSHVEGHNSTSIGVCLVGGCDDAGKPANNFTRDQFTALATELRRLRKQYPNAEILGHRDLSKDIDGDGVVEPHEWLKACPSFDVRAWLKTQAIK